MTIVVSKMIVRRVTMSPTLAPPPKPMLGTTSTGNVGDNVRDKVGDNVGDNISFSLIIGFGVCSAYILALLCICTCNICTRYWSYMVYCVYVYAVYGHVVYV